ncbi:MAG: enoyl-CoA hydratase [Acidobacteriia bacterium]|nr:enoyl-CoA hydratase [Terriglobia bacterium]
MSEPLLRMGTAGPVATIRLNRPRQRNALSMDLMRDLIAVLEGIGTNREVAAVILAAEGSAFCAGHDLNEMVDRNVNEYRQIFDLCTDLMTAIQRIPQPVIAQVHGMATAAGCQLVAACDLVVASENACFATPGVRIGLFCSTPMVALTRAIGRKRALEMLLTGKSIDAATACEWGLVNRVVPRDMLAKTTRDLADEIAQASEMVVGIGKTAFYTQIDLDQSKAYTYAKEVMSMNALASDAQEGMSAFLEKRPPSWTGR